MATNTPFNKPNWGDMFRIWGRNRQLTNREEHLYEKYAAYCEIVGCPAASQESWRLETDKLRNV